MARRPMVLAASPPPPPSGTATLPSTAPPEPGPREHPERPKAAKAECPLAEVTKEKNHAQPEATDKDVLRRHQLCLLTAFLWENRVSDFFFFLKFCVCSAVF